MVQNHNVGVPESGTVNRNGATCLGCGGAVKLPYVREQGREGNMGEQMTAIVAEGNRRAAISLSYRRTHQSRAGVLLPLGGPAVACLNKQEALAYRFMGSQSGTNFSLNVS